jgi:aminoglycoside 6-adenylyltransferase
MEVVPLDPTEPTVAEAIRSVMAAAYEVEATLLGVVDFPPLRRTAAQVAASEASFLGVWEGDTLVAVAEVERRASGHVHLDALVVLPTHFRRGLASALLRRVLVGCPGDELTVSTGRRNSPALRLYLAHGFAAYRHWTTADGVPMVTLGRAGEGPGGDDEGATGLRSGMDPNDPDTARRDDEVLELILAVARSDPRVRAVVLSGSRADPAAPADRWRDFDVVYVVRDVAPFRADPTWIDAFGERAILQRPDAMVDAPPRHDGGETYLMLFVDGHRIDLTLLPVEAMAGFRHEEPTIVLLDRDGLVPPPPGPDAPHHVPAPPTAAAFADVCNEFWWVAPYVAKGLARGELTYARHHLDTVLRAQLLTMLDWEVAAAGGFRRGSGKFGRHLRRALPAAWWERLEATYADADPAHTWAALDAMTALFRTVASGVADRYGFIYPTDDDARVTAHLHRMRASSGTNVVSDPLEG